MKIKYLILDYNGTLTNDAIIGHQASNILFKHYGVPQISLEQFRKTFKTPWMDFFVANGVDKSKINIEKHQKIYREAHNKLVKEISKLNEGALDLLKFAKSKRIKTAILSSRNIADLEQELVHFGVRNYFDAVIGESNVNKDGTQAQKKTEDLIKALSIKDCKEALFVGDMTQDVENARRSNFQSAVITNGWQDEERLKTSKP